MSAQANIDVLLDTASSLVDQTANEVGVDENRPESSGRRAPNRMDVQRLLELEVPVIVTLAQRTMSMAEIMKLSLGAIVEFDIPADSELTLMINNKPLGSGTAVKVGENFGLRITRVVSQRQKVAALGGSAT